MARKEDDGTGNNGPIGQNDQKGPKGLKTQSGQND